MITRDIVNCHKTQHANCPSWHQRATFKIRPYENRSRAKIRRGVEGNSLTDNAITIERSDLTAPLRTNNYAEMDVFHGPFQSGLNADFIVGLCGGGTAVLLRLVRLQLTFYYFYWSFLLFKFVYRCILRPTRWDNGDRFRAESGPILKLIQSVDAYNSHAAHFSQIITFDIINSASHYGLGSLPTLWLR